MPQVVLPSSVRFADFEVDFRAGELRKRGRRIRLQEQPFRVLSMLVERSGDVVSREELRQKLWPADTFVDFDTGLNSAIKKLRDVLGDSAEDPRYIETLPRRGYRFIAQVENGDAFTTAKEEKHVAPVLPIAASPELRKKRGLVIMAGSAFLIVAA